MDAFWTAILLSAAGAAVPPFVTYISLRRREDDKKPDWFKNHALLYVIESAVEVLLGAIVVFAYQLQQEMNLGALTALWVGASTPSLISTIINSHPPILSRVSVG